MIAKMDNNGGFEAVPLSAVASWDGEPLWDFDVESGKAVQIWDGTSWINGHTPESYAPTTIKAPWAQ